MTLTRFGVLAVAVIVLGLGGLTYYYDHALKFPFWSHPLALDSPECTKPDIFQKKLHPDFAKVSVISIATPKGPLRAFYARALQKRTGLGVILIHGGGGNHDNLLQYANYLSQKGWDSLSVDLPNHGCSYNDHRGIQFAIKESENFDLFYAKAESLFKVDALIGTSLGGTVATRWGFLHEKPDRIILENPMFNLKRIVTDQTAYYIPPVIRPMLFWEIFFINKDLILPEITELRPAKNQKVLVMYGTKDDLTPPERQKDEIARAWQGQVEIKMVDSGNHSYLFQRAPGQVEKYLDDFLLKVHNR